MNSSGHQKAGLSLYSQGGLGVTRIERSAGFNETKEALRDALDSEGVEGIIKVLVDRGFDEQNLCEYVEVISSDSIEGSALSAPNVREFLARRYEAVLESISSQARNVLMLWERFKKNQLRGSYEDIQAAFEVYNQNASDFGRSVKESLEELDSFKYLLDCWLSNDAEPVEKFLEGEMDSNLDNITKCVLEIPQPEEGQKFRIPFSIDHASGNIVIESDEDEGPNVQAQVSAEFAIDSAYRYLKFRELLLEVKNRGL